MTAHPPSDPAAEAVSALRTTDDIAQAINAKWDALLGPANDHGTLGRIPGAWRRSELCQEFANALAPLFAALRTRAETERKNREQWAIQAHEFAAAADRLVREKDAAQTRAEAAEKATEAVRSAMVEKHLTAHRLLNETTTDRDRLAAELAEARAENERMRAALEGMVTWSEAYPTSVFLKPDYAKAHVVLTAAGMTLDALSADTMRMATAQIGATARRALTTAKGDADAEA